MESAQEPIQPQPTFPSLPPPISRPPAHYAALPTSARRSHVALLATAYGIGLLLYLSVEPTQDWLILVVTAVAALGADGIMRQHPYGARTTDIAWTAPLLFLPAFFALGAGLFLEDVLSGYAVVPGALVASLAMALFIYADYSSIDEASAAYPGARFILNLGTYLTAFAFYAVVYAFDVKLVPATVTVGLVSMLLAVEILREVETDPLRGMVFAGVVGLIVAEARCVLYFLPLESYLAAGFLLIVFYLVSGLVQHHLNDDLNHGVMAEFSVIALVGVLIVALGRIFEAGI